MTTRQATTYGYRRVGARVRDENKLNVQPQARYHVEIAHYKIADLVSLIVNR
jgi:hypothetical protein